MSEIILAVSFLLSSDDDDEQPEKKVKPPIPSPSYFHSSVPTTLIIMRSFCLSFLFYYTKESAKLLLSFSRPSFFSLFQFKLLYKE